MFIKAIADKVLSEDEKAGLGGTLASMADGMTALSAARALGEKMGNLKMVDAGSDVLTAAVNQRAASASIAVEKSANVESRSA